MDKTSVYKYINDISSLHECNLVLYKAYDKMLEMIVEIIINKTPNSSEKKIIFDFLKYRLVSVKEINELLYKSVSLLFISHPNPDYVFFRELFDQTEIDPSYLFQVCEDYYYKHEKKMDKDEYTFWNQLGKGLIRNSQSFRIKISSSNKQKVDTSNVNNSTTSNNSFSETNDTSDEKPSSKRRREESESTTGMLPHPPPPPINSTSHKSSNRSSSHYSPSHKSSTFGGNSIGNVKHYQGSNIEQKSFSFKSVPPKVVPPSQPSLGHVIKNPKTSVAIKNLPSQFVQQSTLIKKSIEPTTLEPNQESAFIDSVEQTVFNSESSNLVDDSFFSDEFQ